MMGSNYKSLIGKLKVKASIKKEHPKTTELCETKKIAFEMNTAMI